MPTADPVVTVVVPARDAAATLGATLDGLAAQVIDDAFEVVVVDNGSLDTTPEVAEGAGIGRVIRRERGAGPGAARNDGVAAASAPLIAFLDSDCIPAPGWLAAGVRALEDADLVQGRVNPIEGSHIGPFDRTLSVQSEYGLYETANLFVRKEWFDRAGGFQDFIPAGGRPFGEDSWWAWRVRRAGARTGFSADALVQHAVFPGTRKAHVQETSQRRWFPALVKRVPELREAFLWQRIFLSRRTAAFDLAAVGVATAVLSRRPWALAAAVPYARMVRDGTRRASGDPKAIAIGDVAADAAGAAALVRGSIAARTPVL
jgi:glycosyltransferase involved in cell wall biosynthesis